MTIDCTLNMDCRSLPPGVLILYTATCVRPHWAPQYESYSFKKIDERVGKIEKHEKEKEKGGSQLSWGRIRERIVHVSNVLQVPRSMPQIRHRFTTREVLSASSALSDGGGVFGCRGTRERH
jgi:hypothetical protein